MPHMLEWSRAYTHRLTAEAAAPLRARAPEIAQLGMRALAAATLSNLMSATIAGFFIGL